MQSDPISGSIVDCVRYKEQLTVPIVLIHGVDVRSSDWWQTSGLEDNLRRYVAPVLQKSEKVNIYPVFWGDAGATFRWDHRSLPGDEQRSIQLQVADASRLSTDETRTRLLLSTPDPSPAVSKFLSLNSPPIGDR